MCVMTIHTAIANDPHMSFQIRPGDLPLAEPVGELVDGMLACYVDWREDCARLADVHRQWREAPAADNDEWYSTYRAALDREEAAATAYELAVWHVERSLFGDAQHSR